MGELIELPVLLPVPLEPAPPLFHPLDEEPEDDGEDEFADLFRPMASAGEVAMAPTKRPATVLAINFLFMLYLLDEGSVMKPYAGSFIKVRQPRMESVLNRIDHVNVLLIEDDEADVFLVQEILKRARHSDLPPFEILSAGTLSEGLRALEEKSPDIVLLDLMLPDSRGMDSLRAVVAKAGEIPVVVLSGVNDETLSIEAARYGAQDFLVKGHVETMWLSRIMRYALARKKARVAEGKNLVAKVARALEAVEVKTDASRRIVKTNEAAEQLFGPDLVGRSEEELEERLRELADKISKKCRTEGALERT